MGAAGSVNKVFWSELDVALHETALDLLGPTAEVGVRLDRRLPLLALRPDLRRHQRDPAQHRRRAHPRPPPRSQGSHADEVRPRPTSSATSPRSLDELLAAADTVGAARAWAAGDHGPGLALWQTLADQGVTVARPRRPRRSRSASPSRRSAGTPSPGPGSSRRRTCPSRSADEVSRRASGTVAVPPHVPYALDADVADQVFVVDGDALASATVGRGEDVDRPDAAPVRGFEARGARTVDHRADLDAAFDLAVLATAAQLLGAGERILADSVTYVKQRKQFGREIGSYQAIKHQLADVRIALDFARPLVYGAAVVFDGPIAHASLGGEGRGAAMRRTSPRASGCRCTARSATPPSTTCRCGCSRSARSSAPGARPRSTGGGCSSR